MKKSILAVLAAFSLCSCSTVMHTASTEAVDTELNNRTSAELKVSDKRVSYTLVTNSAQRKAGLKSIKNAAVLKALEANGGGDVLVAPQFEIVKRTGLFGTKIKQVTVTGHPATYVNFHPTTPAEADVIYTIDGNPKFCAPCK